jgi:hypothetical protein
VDKSTIGVDHNLSSSKTCVCLRTTLDESAGWIDVPLGLGIDREVGESIRNDSLADFILQFIQILLLVVLYGNDDGRHSERFLIFIFDRDLSLSV